jgi:hypothetical protein
MPNALPANPVDDEWNYQVEFVHAKFPPGSSGSAQIALTYFLNSKRNIVPNPSGTNNERMNVFVSRYNNCGPSNEDASFISLANIVPAASGIPGKPTPPNSSVKAYDVNLALSTSLVDTRKNWWTKPTDDVDHFTLGFCVRTELEHSYLNKWTKVAFDETNVEVEIKLDAKFGPLVIQATADQRQVDKASAAVSYAVKACVCSQTNICVTTPPPFHPNQDLRVCVQSLDPTVEINNISQMTLSQTGTPIVTVVAGELATSPLTTMGSAILGARQIYWVETPLLAQFFTSSNPGAIKADGTALMQFARRKLRNLEEIAGQGEFTVDVPYDPNLESDTAAPKNTSYAALVTALAALIMWRMI